jgi:hypothetical protein
MFYLFRNGKCQSLCDDKERLEKLVTEDDKDAVILENESWLNPSDLSIVDGKIQIREIVQTEIAINQQILSVIRSKRDKLLSDSDWTQFLDSPLTDEKKKEWQVYRQALRDMPEKGCTDLDNPYWPIIPKV